MPGYRPPSREPHGKWARAIHAKRRADKISQTGGFRLLGPKLGLGPNSRQSYINLDMGDHEPTEDEATVLAEWLGGYPEDEPVVELPETGDLASAIRALTAELQLLRESQASAGAATANLVAVAIRETLQAAGLAREPQKS